jgi:hypothetical protein
MGFVFDELDKLLSLAAWGVSGWVAPLCQLGFPYRDFRLFRCSARKLTEPAKSVTLAASGVVRQTTAGD